MESQIIKLEEELRLAMLHNDVEKLDELIDDSLIFTTPNGGVVTKQMDLDAHRAKIQIMTTMSASEQVIQTYESCVVVSVKMEIKGQYNDTPILGNYRYLRVWSKIKDKYRVVAGSVVQLLD